MVVVEEEAVLLDHGVGCHVVGKVGGSDRGVVDHHAGEVEVCEVVLINDGGRDIWDVSSGVGLSVQGQ